jgi:hypothetical protein
MNSMYLCYIIVEGNLGKNFLNHNLTFDVILLCVLSAMIYHLVWQRMNSYDICKSYLTLECIHMT